MAIDASLYASGDCEIDVACRELRLRGAPVPLGGCAFEISQVLAQSAGELVTKDELMNRVWPGAVVMENTLQVHAAAIRKALGPYRDLLKTEARRGYRLLGAWTTRGSRSENVRAGSQSPQRPIRAAYLFVLVCGIRSESGTTPPSTSKPIYLAPAIR